MPSVRLSPRAYGRLTLVAAVAVAFIIVTGGAVRLTGSGLGCPTWPACTHTQVVAPLSFHPLVEFVNRLVTAAVSVAVILAVLGALVRVPRRRDLTVLSVGLVVGVLAQIVLGGLTVLAKLAPPFVMAHFLLSMALLWDAVVLHHRAGLPDGATGGTPPRRLAIDRDVVRMIRLIGVLTAIVLVAGTVVTSSGPHGGDASAPRFDLSLHRVTQIHGSFAMLLVALVVAVAVLARVNRASVVLQVRAWQLLEALSVQVAIGYAQYFTGVPTLLVGFHILGATVVWTAALRLNLAVSEVPDDLVRPTVPAGNPPALVLSERP